MRLASAPGYVSRHSWLLLSTEGSRLAASRMLRPSGDQASPLTQPHGLPTWRRSPLDASTVTSLRSNTPAAPRTTAAMRLPSGDQAGVVLTNDSEFFLSSTARLRSPLPSTAATRREDLPAVGLCRMNAMRFPSGENETPVSMSNTSLRGVPPSV